ITNWESESVGDFVRDITWDPVGRVIATIGEDNTIHLWESETGKMSKRVRERQKYIRKIVWSPDGSMFALGASDYTVQLWKANGVLNNVLEGHHDWIRSIAWSRDGRFLVSVAVDGT